MHRFHAPQCHVHDLIQLVNEKNGIGPDGNGRHFAFRDRPDEMNLFFPIGRTNHRLIVSGGHRFGELSSNHTMVTGLTGFMHVDQEILIIDGDLDQISYVEFRQSLIFSHVHGEVSRLSLTHSDFGLVASDVRYRAQKNPVSGNEMSVCLFRTGYRLTDGCARDGPHCKHSQ